MKVHVEKRMPYISKNKQIPTTFQQKSAIDSKYSCIVATSIAKILFFIKMFYLILAIFKISIITLTMASIPKGTNSFSQHASQEHFFDFPLHCCGMLRFSKILPLS